MQAEQQHLWRYSIRGLQARDGTQTACGGFAMATLDFEPPSDPASGYMFVNGLDLGRASPYFRRTHLDVQPESVEAYVAAVDEGIRLALEAVYGQGLIAVQVVLQDAYFHAVDASNRAFWRVGQKAVLMALEQAVVRQRQGDA